ncbi:MAG: hypothetical protein G8345_13550 [Magnetococcales bacterium]|nr:hypothetical protein [Magnetococcales bacterium]NGZ27899.1 hypothetical protein [Magnetococcales bacterium]
MNKIAVATAVKKVTSLLYYVTALALLTAVGMEVVSRLSEKHFAVGQEPPRQFPVLRLDGGNAWQVVRWGELDGKPGGEAFLVPVGRGHVAGHGQILTNYQVEENPDQSRLVTLQWVTDDYTYLSRYLVSQQEVRPLSLRKRGVGEALLGLVAAWGVIAAFRKWRRSSNTP